MSSICRTCDATSNLINIFEYGTATAEKLMSVANVEVRIYVLSYYYYLYIITGLLLFVYYFIYYLYFDKYVIQW